MLSLSHLLLNVSALYYLFHRGLMKLQQDNTNKLLKVTIKSLILINYQVRVYTDHQRLSQSIVCCGYHCKKKKCVVQSILLHLFCLVQSWNFYCQQFLNQNSIDGKNDLLIHNVKQSTIQKKNFKHEFEKENQRIRFLFESSFFFSL